MAFGWLIALAGCVSYGVAGRWRASSLGFRITVRDPRRPLLAAAILGLALVLTQPGLRAAIARRSTLLFYLAAAVGLWWLTLGPSATFAGVPLRWPSPVRTAGDGSRLRRPPRARALVHAGRPLPVGGGKPGLRESAARAALASRSPDSHVRADCRRRLGAEAPARARPCPVAGHGHARFGQAAAATAGCTAAAGAGCDVSGRPRAAATGEWVQRALPARASDSRSRHRDVQTSRCSMARALVSRSTSCSIARATSGGGSSGGWATRAQSWRGGRVGGACTNCPRHHPGQCRDYPGGKHALSPRRPASTPISRRASWMTASIRAGTQPGRGQGRP